MMVDLTNLFIDLRSYFEKPDKDANTKKSPYPEPKILITNTDDEVFTTEGIEQVIQCLSILHRRARGATDNASDYGSEDCRFESCRARILFTIFLYRNPLKKTWTRSPCLPLKKV